MNIALGRVALSLCPQFDLDGSETVSVSELITAVGRSLNGCP